MIKLSSFSSEVKNWVRKEPRRPYANPGLEFEVSSPLVSCDATQRSNYNNPSFEVFEVWPVTTTDYDYDPEHGTHGPWDSMTLTLSPGTL